MEIHCYSTVCLLGPLCIYKQWFFALGTLRSYIHYPTSFPLGFFKYTAKPARQSSKLSLTDNLSWLMALQNQESSVPCDWLWAIAHLPSPPLPSSVVRYNHIRFSTHYLSVRQPEQGLGNHSSSVTSISYRVVSKIG